jgi:UDP-N-acetylmuramoyl-tripeptide--D-alanyl-D-alanine ligase
MATPIPENRVELTLAEIALATGGQIRPGAGERVCGITTDSRADVEGKLFVALEGESFDGHAFAAAAARRGAAAVMVSRDVGGVPDPVAVVRVGSTLSALGALARQHRRRWGKRLVAVGGSAGKTTTRSAIQAVLSAAHPGALHASPGNLNNLVGVPMVLFGLAPEHELGLVEVGTNQRGEVARLALVCEPDLAVLTLVAIEHAAGIGSLDAIEAEEGDLLAAIGPAGAAIGNGDDERVRRQLARSTAGTKLTYGAGEGSDYRVLRREPRGLSATRIALERPHGARRELLELDVGLVGLPGALAAAAAVAVVDRIAGAPQPPELLRAALGGALSEPGRLCPVELGDGSVLIDDSYNANPASVLAAVAAAREIAEARGARLLLALGEMRELGEASRREHEQLGRALADCGAAGLVAICGDAELFVDHARGGIDAEFVADARSAIAPLLARVRPGDVVLVKASRGVHAEQVVAALLEAKGRAA